MLKWRQMTMRAAIYARVSTAEQHSEMQMSELRDHADRRGWKIVGQYVDEGVSGTKASRPQLDKLMADARRRRFDLVCVWRFDRFARSTQHLLAALEEFRNLGVNFISLNEAIDTSTPLGKMVFTVVAAVAELERTIIVERVRAGLARAKAKGKRLGRPVGSGIDAVEVGRLRESGLSFREIAKKMGIGQGSAQRAWVAYQKTPPKSGLGSPMKAKGGRTHH
jgi:DNA invertase Pin-like site-specific DNA recombinase